RVTGRGDRAHQPRARRPARMAAALPVLISPLLGLGVLHTADSLGGKPSVVGVYGSEYLPPDAGTDPLAPVAWLSLAPEAPAGGARAAAPAPPGRPCPGPGHPPLFVPRDSTPPL